MYVRAGVYVCIHIKTYIKIKNAYNFIFGSVKEWLFFVYGWYSDPIGKNIQTESYFGYIFALAIGGIFPKVIQ